MDILGIGECMIELYSEEPVLFSSGLRVQVGGDIYNTLVTASRLGSRTALFSRIAMDEFGQILLEQFEKNAIDSLHVQRSCEGHNGVYFVLFKGQDSHKFVYYRQNSAASRINPGQFNADLVKQAKIIYASGITQAISPSARETVLKAFSLAKQHKTLVAYDPNYRPALWKNRTEALEALLEVLPYVDIILPTAGDLRAIFDFEKVSDMVDYFRCKDIPIVAVKQGKEGVTIGYKRHRSRVPSHPVEKIKDSVGAGDAFNGGFLHGIIKRLSLEECAKIGIIAASFSLKGAGPISALPEWHQVEVLPDGQLKGDCVPLTLKGPLRDVLRGKA